MAENLNNKPEELQDEQLDAVAGGFKDNITDDREHENPKAIGLINP